MKLPTHIEIDLEPCMYYDFPEKYKKILHKGSLKKIPDKLLEKHRIRLRLRFSKMHWRYHEYKITEMGGTKLVLEKL